MIKGKSKQDPYNKTFIFYIFQGQISSGLTLESCTVLCRTVVSVSLRDESRPLLDQFAFCESMKKCFSLGDSPKTHYSSFIPFLWGSIISLTRKFGTPLSYRILQRRFSYVLAPCNTKTMLGMHVILFFLMRISLSVNSVTVTFSQVNGWLKKCINWE